jgi:predicted molibdopterin-dependent oxidoreductase YjgC
VSVPHGDYAEAMEWLTGEDSPVRGRERVVLVWSGPGGRGGEEVAHLAFSLGLHDQPESGAFYLPATPNGRAVARAWDAAGSGEPTQGGSIGLLLVSGEEAAADPALRDLAARSDAVVCISMFSEDVRGWAGLVLPGTSYLERDGSMLNLEGRLQRLRRAVIPPAPDELAWIAKLAERFGVALEPYAPSVFAEVSALAFDGVAFGEVGERAVLPPPLEAVSEPVADTRTAAPRAARGGPLRLVRYRSLFSGPAVARVPQLGFQRPEAAVELSAEDARVRGIESGDVVRVSSNGSSVELRARINRRLVAGAVRAADEHVRALARAVEVSKA